MQNRGAVVVTDLGYGPSSYAVSIPGSIIANPGFLKVYGTIGSAADGTLALDADHVAA